MWYPQEKVENVNESENFKNGLLVKQEDHIYLIGILDTEMHLKIFAIGIFSCRVCENCRYQPSLQTGRRKQIDSRFRNIRWSLV